MGKKKLSLGRRGILKGLGALSLSSVLGGIHHVSLNVDDAEAAVAEAALYQVKAISAPVPINAGPNKGRKVVYLRDWDGVTFEFIEVAAK